MSATSDGRMRTRELVAVRERFVEASATARSALQTAVAEWYVMLCSLALGRTDTARTAWVQLNGAVTTMALDLSAAVEAAQRTAAKNRGRARSCPPAQGRQAHEAERIRTGAVEAADLVESLIVEAGVLG